MITVFKRIKSDLMQMYEVLRDNPDNENIIKKDMLIAQQIITDSLKKLKTTIASNQTNKSRPSLYDDKW